MSEAVLFSQGDLFLDPQIDQGSALTPCARAISVSFWDSVFSIG